MGDKDNSFILFQFKVIGAGLCTNMLLDAIPFVRCLINILVGIIKHR